MRQALLIAWQDLRHQLRQGETLLWLFLMPPLFFYFIGTVTGGMSSAAGRGAATPLAVYAESPGFLQAQVDRRLRENDFEPTWYSDAATDDGAEAPTRTLTIGPYLSATALLGEPVSLRYETRSSSLTRDFEGIRVQRAIYTTLADIVVAGAQPGPLDAESLERLNAAERFATLDVRPAGRRLEIPSGFDQAIPGILVMFTLLVLLTSSASQLAIERRQGLLRRLAFAPLGRGEIVLGKWGARMGLAMVQIAAALAIGTLLFRMHWGPDIAMVLVVLVAWAAFCASAGLLLGCLARTENQAVGLGVLLANALAALGGCWWPIEVTPDWMQALAKLLPTGWAMEALHRLVSFEAGAASAIPQVAILLVAAALVGSYATRQFRYQ